MTYYNTNTCWLTGSCHNRFDRILSASRPARQRSGRPREADGPACASSQNIQRYFGFLMIHDDSWWLINIYDMIQMMIRYGATSTCFMLSQQDSTVFCVSVYFSARFGVFLVPEPRHRKTPGRTETQTNRNLEKMQIKCTKQCESMRIAWWWVSYPRFPRRAFPTDCAEGDTAVDLYRAAFGAQRPHLGHGIGTGVAST